MAIARALASVVVLTAALTVPIEAQVSTTDTFGPATETPLGTFGGIAYVQYDGMFEGETSTGPFRVPYRISAPLDTALSNQSVVVEAPHFAVGVGARDLYLTPGFLFGRGFVHAGVGWSTVGNRVLDPTAPGTFIDGGFHEFGGKVDDEIITEFARALSTRPEAADMVGTVSRRYVTGLSDSTIPILRLIESGRAAGVFDLALPFTADKGFDPQAALAAGRFPGKLIVLNSEVEDSRGYVDRGTAPNQYRFFVVAGSPHIPDHVDPPGRTSGTTPATFSPALRAHFAQGHDWVRRGQAPPLSTQLRMTRGNTVDRDAAGNAITVDRTGRIVPRLPFIDLGEARFVATFIGSYDQVRTIGQLGFATHQAYAKAFADRVSAYAKAGFVLTEDATAMRQRATLCPPSTYTETYRDHYAEFASITPCGS